MTSIHKSAVVPFSAGQMYTLVNDIESYPDFLPWCQGTTILSRGTENLTASISLRAGKVNQSFTTENTMEPGHRIDMNLVEGPFKILKGRWLFEQMDDHTCKVSINMDFQFSNRLIKFALDKIFTHVINTLIDAFTDRAFQVYGGQQN